MSADNNHAVVEQTDSSPHPKASVFQSPLTFKVYYFLFYSAIGSSIPYLALYFKQLGLNAGSVGFLLGIRVSTEIIGAPLWGIIGDRFKIRKFILLASLASFAIGTLLFLSIQPQNQQCIEVRADETKIKPLIFTSAGVLLGSQLQQPFELHEPLLPQNRSLQFIRKRDDDELKTIFLILLSIMVLGQIFGSAVFAMSDAVVVAFLAEKVNTFGSFRIWGEVGVAVGSLTVGGFISFSQSKVCGLIVNNYFISFYFFAGFIVAAMCTAVGMKVTYPDKQGSAAAESRSYSSLIQKLLEPYNLTFVLGACLFGAFVGFQENFGLWYLDDLGANPYMIGVAAGLRYTTAVMGYLSSGTLTDSLGVECPIAACLLLYSAVFLGLSFVHQPWLGVALFSVEGALYGLGWSSFVVFGGRISYQVGFSAAVQGKEIVPKRSICNCFSFHYHC